MVVATDDTLVIEFFSQDESFAVQILEVDGQIDARIAADLGVFISKDDRVDTIRVSADTVAAVGAGEHAGGSLNLTGDLGVLIGRSGSDDPETCEAEEDEFPTRVLGGNLVAGTDASVGGKGGKVVDPGSTSVLGDKLEKVVGSDDGGEEEPSDDKLPTVPELDPDSGDCLCEIVSNLGSLAKLAD